MKKTPVRGMKDFLPEEMALRDYVQGTILSVYRSFGYQRISTPIVEDKENLEKSEGGDNLNLMYQILKRGQKLESAKEKGDALWDLGLRYDLTLPLSRFYAANQHLLPSPFKCIQTDRAYRAENPQKGRMREFVQCDIDIIGDESEYGEVELIAVTAKALQAVDFTGFTVWVNDRQVLRAALIQLGFALDTLESVCVTLDKLDKIALEGVTGELSEKGFPESAIASLSALLSKGEPTLEDIANLLSNAPEIARLQRVIGEAKAIGEAEGFTADFKFTLVRGQGYYTGTIFEIEYLGYPGSVAGGGRYDGLIGKFTGTPVSSIGFSIGFERITSILMEKGFALPSRRKHIALVYETQSPTEVFSKVQALTEEGFEVTAMPRPKNVGKLFARLEGEGYHGAFFLTSGEMKVFGA